MPKDPTDIVSEAHSIYGLPAGRPHIEQLISNGRLKVASVDLLKLGRPLNEQHDLSISEALSEQRSEN